MITIQLEARLQLNIGSTFERALMVFTCSDITLPTVNQFGWNLEHSGYIVGGWPWQILSAIRAAARELESQAKFCYFLSGKQRTILPISCGASFMKFEHKTSIGVAMNPFGTEFWKFSHRVVFQKKHKIEIFFTVVWLEATITLQWL